MRITFVDQKHKCLLKLHVYPKKAVDFYETKYKIQNITNAIKFEIVLNGTF